MENETLNQNGAQAEKVSTLHQVTPLSKYLAMTLFIILPFLGGYIGYMYAPEKVVEVEKIVEIESSSSEHTNLESTTREVEAEIQTYSHVLQEPNGYNPFLVDPKKGSLVQNVPVDGIHYNIFETSVLFKPPRLPENDLDISGKFVISQNAIAGAVQVIFHPDSDSLQKLPWPSTHRDPIEEYALGNNQWGLNPSIICEAEELCNELFILLDNVEGSTLVVNGTGTVNVLRQVVEDRRSEYEGPVPDGLIEFKDIQLQTNPFTTLRE